MTRKHFRELASLVNMIGIPEKARVELADRLADFCAQQNPRFDRAKFLSACALESRPAVGADPKSELDGFRRAFDKRVTK